MTSCDPMGRFMDDKIYKNLFLQSFIFENLENPRFVSMKSAIFFWFVFVSQYVYKKKILTIEMEDGRLKSLVQVNIQQGTGMNFRVFAC